jgi:hypothetical protein
MPRGSHVTKGMRPGGRTKGTPNKRTTERLEAERIERQAQDAVNAVAHRTKKLAKDVLEDYVGAFAAMAAVYQNRIATAFQQQTEPSAADLAGFEKWGGMTAKFAGELAAFQSPKFKAIQVMAPPPSINPPKDVTKDGNIVTIDDPVAMARVYARMVKQVR